MTTIQAQIIGNSAVVPRDDFDRLIELARRSDTIDLQVFADGNVLTRDMMRLAEESGAFQFWRDAGEDIYSTHDGEPVR
jgi:hypothetical protein